MISPGAAPQYSTVTGIPEMLKLHVFVVHGRGEEDAGAPSLCAVTFAPKPFPQSVQAPPSQVCMAVPFASNTEGPVADNVTGSG